MVLSRRAWLVALVLSVGPWWAAAQAQAPTPQGIATPMPSAAQARIGFALACGVEHCVPAGDGSGEWRFTGTPRVAALRTGSPAERAGLRVHDRIRRVNGVAVVGMRSGALSRLFAVESARVEVEREGKRVELVIVTGSR
jgi:membrane-associated protease RseP (regulator of RpoE activity)